ncbi:MAG: hypothetical protein PHE47_08925 [Oscillospiraceae bacterium]|nr:hypothetical protein [Oscillospiraceae bacterium]
MEKPAHVLSFLMSYPQYRDYYFYQVGGKRPAWRTPELFLAAGVLAAAISLLCRGGLSGGMPALSWAMGCAAIVCVGAYFAVRIGCFVFARRRVMRRYRVKWLGKKEMEIRFYEDFFTAHFPTVAFDGFYKEISGVDRTRRLEILLLQNGAKVPIPNEAWTPQLAAFLADRMENRLLVGNDQA